MSDIKSQLIRLGNANPALRRHLKPVIAAFEDQPDPDVGYDLRRDWQDRTRETQKAAREARVKDLAKDVNAFVAEASGREFQSALDGLEKLIVCMRRERRASKAYEGFGA